MPSSSPLYDYSIVPFIKTIQNLLHIMNKAERYAQEKGQDVESYTKLRIHPDMGDFTFQIQRLSNAAKLAYSKVSKASVDPESFAMPDNETTWQQLKDRLSRTITILEGAKAEDFVGQEGKEMEWFGGKARFNMQTYLQHYAVPNFYFHATTTYDLLRGVGVPLGKQDFILGEQEV